jgi:hypothetical protein
VDIATSCVSIVISDHEVEELMDADRGDLSIARSITVFVNPLHARIRMTISFGPGIE